MEITPEVKEMSFREWEKRFKTSESWMAFINRVNQYKPHWVGDFPPVEEWYFFYILGKIDGFNEAKSTVGTQSTLG